MIKSESIDLDIKEDIKEELRETESKMVLQMSRANSDIFKNEEEEAGLGVDFEQVLDAELLQNQQKPTNNMIDSIIETPE